MEDAPLPNMSITPKKAISETIDIIQENITYKLLIEIEEITMKIKIVDEDPFIGTYSRIISMTEIKDLHPAFAMLNSFNEFLDYFTALAKNKKIDIKQTNDSIAIDMSVEYLLKQNNIEIILTQEDVNYNKISKLLKNEITLLKEKMNDMEIKYKNIVEKQNEDNMKLIEENNNIKNRMELLEDENKHFKEELSKCINYIKEIKTKSEEKKDEIIINQKINSSIMESEEYDMIESALTERINKSIKKIKKLYQATVDGGDASIFHKLCDNIPNTLILIKSAGDRRFGGFTSECWESSIKRKNDKNAFLFSLDKNKIYKNKNYSYSIYCNSLSGPCFGFGNTIKIGKNVLKDKTLKTFESNPECSYEFDGDNNALSEDGKNEGVLAKEYEVFQIIFS